MVCERGQEGREARVALLRRSRGKVRRKHEKQKEKRRRGRRSCGEGQSEKKKKEEREEKTQEVPHEHLLEQMLRTSSNCFLHHREKKQPVFSPSKK